MISDDHNLYLATSIEEVDRINQRFYGRFQFPQPPLSFGAPTDTSFETIMLNQSLGHWDHSAVKENSRIWVAGCGTNQAVFVSLRFPNATIIASDLSAQSISTSRKTADSLGLKNIEFRQQSINTVGYKDEFDLIFCTGVIHHNADPLVPLARLASALKETGHLELMVYNRYHRVLTTAFQKAIRTLCSKADLDEELRFARKMVMNLRSDNLMAKFILQQHGLSESEFADNLLQPVEHSYTVESLQSLLAEQNLEIVSPCVNQYDKASQTFHWNLEFSDKELSERYHALPDIDRWRISNHLMMEKSPLLWFYVRKRRQSSAPSEKTLCDGFLQHRFKRSATKKITYIRSPDGLYKRNPQLFEHPGIHPDSHCRKILDAVDAEPGRKMLDVISSLGVATDFTTVNRLRICLTTPEFPYLIALRDA